MHKLETVMENSWKKVCNVCRDPDVMCSWQFFPRIRLLFPERVTYNVDKMKASLGCKGALDGGTQYHKSIL